MTPIFRANPFLSRNNRFLRLPGGEGDAMRIGDSIGVQLFDYRFADAVIPFMYAGTNMRSGEQRLTFRDGSGQPFPVSDAVVAHAGQIAAEMASYYVEAFPDFGIRTNLNPGQRDPIPRYKDPNEDPWRSFLGYDVIRRVDTELGEMVVAAGDVFEIRVGAGSSCGVPGLWIDGKQYAVRLDYRVDDGRVLLQPLKGSKVPGVLLEPVSNDDVDMPMSAPKHIVDTVARVAEQVAGEFLKLNFSAIRSAIVRNVSHRNDMVLAARSILRRSMETAGPALKDFLRARYTEFEPLHADYLAIINDLQAMTGSEEAQTADRTPEQHYVRWQLTETGPAP